MGFLGERKSGAGGSRRADGDEDGIAAKASPTANIDGFATSDLYGEPGSDAQAATNADGAGDRCVPMVSSSDSMELEAADSGLWGSVFDGLNGSAGNGGLGLPDVDAMKEQVRKNLLRPSYDVRDLYNTEGAFQAVARAQWFENATLSVIALNALWIWIDTDYNKAEMLIMAAPVFQVVEHFFCIYFSFEWTMRFASFRKKRSGLRDGWFVFDSALVLMMVLETWVMTAVMLAVGGGSSGGALGNASILRMARLLRLSRMARMVRLFRAMPELLILIKGMVAATRSVFFTLCLLLILLYIFGIAFRQLMEGSAVGEERFDTVLASMYTLLIDGTFMDNLGTVVRDVGKESPVCAALMWFFVLLSSLTVMNMLIGVLCEVVSAVAATEKETIIVSFVREKMSTLFKHLDASGDGLISKEEFLGILKIPEASRLLEEVGVDVVGLVDQADAIFMESDEVGEFDKELTFPDLMEVILELRGTNTAKVKNIVELRKTLMTSVSQIHKSIAGLEEKLEEIQGVPHNQRACVRRTTRRGGSKALSMVKTSSGEGKEASGGHPSKRRLFRRSTWGASNFEEELSKTSMSPWKSPNSEESSPTFATSDGELHMNSPATLPLHSSAASPRGPDSSQHAGSQHNHLSSSNQSGHHSSHRGGSHRYHHSYHSNHHAPQIPPHTHHNHRDHHNHNNHHNHHNHHNQDNHSSPHHSSHGSGLGRGATFPHPGTGLSFGGVCSSSSLGRGDEFGAHVATATASVVKEVSKEVAALVAQLQRAVATAKGDIEREALLLVSPSEGPRPADGEAVSVGMRMPLPGGACALDDGAVPTVNLPGALDDESTHVASTRRFCGPVSSRAHYGSRLGITGPVAEAVDPKAFPSLFVQPGVLSGPPPTTLAPACVFHVTCDDKASTASVSRATASGRGVPSSTSTASASATAMAGGACGGTGAVSAEGSSEDLSVKLACALRTAASPLAAGTDEGPPRCQPRVADFAPLPPDQSPLVAAKRLFFAVAPDSSPRLDAGGGALPTIDLEDIRSHLSSLLEAVQTVTLLQKIRDRVAPLQRGLSEGGVGGGGGGGGDGGGSIGAVGGVGAVGGGVGGRAAPEAPTTNPRPPQEALLLS